MNTTKFFKENNVEYHYINKAYKYYIDGDLIIDNVEYIDDYTLNSVYVNGNLIINDLVETGRYVMKASLIKGDLILPKLKNPGSDLLLNTYIEGDIILDGLEKLQKTFLTNRYINGDLSLNSLKVANNKLYNITLIGSLFLKNVTQIKNGFLSDSFVDVNKININKNVKFDDNFTFSHTTIINNIVEDVIDENNLTKGFFKNKVARVKQHHISDFIKYDDKINVYNNIKYLWFVLNKLNINSTLATNYKYPQINIHHNINIEWLKKNNILNHINIDKIKLPNFDKLTI